MKSEIADLKFEQPPPLDEWLKGRTILTVAQDGRGQFRTIAEAVKSLKPGQVVEILDQGPYRENVWIENPPPDTGIVSRSYPIVLPDRWRVEALDLQYGTAHHVNASGSFRVSGLVISHPKDPLPAGCSGSQVMTLGPTGKVIVDNCILTRNDAADIRPVNLGVVARLSDAHILVDRCCIAGSFSIFRDAAFSGQRPQCVLRQSWLHSFRYSLLGMTGNMNVQAVVQNNVIEGQACFYLATRRDPQPTLHLLGPIHVVQLDLRRAPVVRAL